MANTISSTALTTLADTKAFLPPLPGTVDDDLIIGLINAASNRIEILTGRKFAAADYRERVSGSASRRLTLKNRPLIQVHRVAWGNDNALSVTYSGSGIRGTVDVTASSLIMRSTGTDGTLTSAEQAFSDYASTDALVTQIKTVADWDATLIDNVPSADLNPTVGLKAKGVTAYLTWPDQDQVVHWANFDAGIVALANRKFSTWPTRSSAYPGGFQNLLVNYRGGYENVTAADDTADLRQLCWEFVGEALQRRGLNTNVASESLGDHAKSMISGVQLTEDRLARLRHWSDIPIGAAH